MRQRMILALTAMVAIGLTLPTTALGQEEFGQNVNNAIESAVTYLWSLQNEDGSWKTYGGHGGHEDEGLGSTALVVYALIEAGVSPQDARMLKAFDYLESKNSTHTYSAGLRTVAFQVANEQTNNKYVSQVKSDMGKLITAQSSGGYGYEVPRFEGGATDNSNSQYAVLAAWYAGMNDRVDIPSQYWVDLQGYWRRCQQGTGGWAYRVSGSNTYYDGATQPTMTVGGLASLYICEDNIPLSRRPDSGAIERCDGVVMDPAIAKALAWMDANYTADPTQAGFAAALGFGELQKGWAYYYIYGVERAGIASGYKYFGGLDWYRTGAEYLINNQSGDGSWVGYDADAVWSQGVATPTTDLGKIQANTAFALLFLIRGRQPVLFNKLEHAGDWDNRSRDLAAVTHWLSRNYEHSVNWQIADINAAVSEWRDAPFLYITGKNAVSFNDAQIAKMRDYVYKGGTILSTTQADGPAFKTSIREFYEKAFPDYKLEVVPAGHPLYNKPFKLESGKPTIYMVSNGVRPLAIHIDDDISLALMSRKSGEKEKDAWAFQAMANITLYTIDTLFDLPARGVTTWPAAAETAAASLGGNSASLIYLIDEAGNIQPVPASYAGLTVDLGDGSQLVVPMLDAEDRVTVYCEPTNEYINIPITSLGATLLAPDGSAAFLAAEPEAPSMDELIPEMPYNSGDLAVIRLKNKDNDANCDPEPYAWPRFCALMEERENKNVWVSRPVEIVDLVETASDRKAKLAVLTGTEELELSRDEIEAMTSFIAEGGLIFIDAAGGSEDFATSFRKLAAGRKFYKNRANMLVEMNTKSELFSAGGKNLSRVKYRRQTAVAVQTNDPVLSVMVVDGKPAIIFSDYDVTAGLVGYTSGSVEGYSPESCYGLMRNLILLVNPGK